MSRGNAVNADGGAGGSALLADEVDPDRLVKTFLELVAIDSPTGHEERIGNDLSARFSALGCSASMDDIGNLVAVLPGTRPGTVLLSTP